VINGLEIRFVKSWYCVVPENIHASHTKGIQKITNTSNSEGIGNTRGAKGSMGSEGKGVDS